MPQVAPDRGQWKSRLGFILAASGSAIGLGNIVFFSANAYKFGGGAFYLPYFIALLAIGIPVMILEFGLGNLTGRAFPESLYKIAGRKGEFAGWWGIFNAGFITFYYITILGWVLGMLIGALGPVWRESLPVPAFGMEEGALHNPYAFFFDMISTWRPLLFVAVVWVLNGLIIRKSANSIEPVTKIFVPLMWVFMIILIIRGVTLENGGQGVLLLFTPDFSVMKDPDVWQGAISQIFFTLSLGFGIMTAYASYLPKKSDQTQNAVITSLLNCGFEYIAGLAVFSILFAFAVVPKASTLGMMFFIVPTGIGQLPGGSTAVILFGFMFFLLLLLAGLSSSISLVEALVSSMVDKFRWARKKCVIWSCVVGFIFSIGFTLPQVVNPGLEDDGTLGFTLIDLVDHWAFSYGLLIVGLIECILVGWVLGARRIREHINQSSRFRLGVWFDWLIKVVVPGMILFVIGFSVAGEFRDGIYGSPFSAHYAEGWSWLDALPGLIFGLWIVLSTTAAVTMTVRGEYRD